MKAAKNSREWILLPAIILGLLFRSSDGFCQSFTDCEIMHKFSAKFGEHARDFTDFAKATAATSETGDWILTMHLSNLASKYEDSTDFIGDELFIVLFLETEKDKQEVRKMVQKRIQNTIQEIDKYTLSEINIGLADAKKPALVVQANKLKDDLKDFQEALREINDKLAQSGKDSEKQKNQ